jgi:hypothetical protein
VPSLHDGRVRNGTQITPSEDDWVGLASPPSLIQQDGEASLVEPQNSCRTARRCANENAKIKDPDYQLWDYVVSFATEPQGPQAWYDQLVETEPSAIRSRALNPFSIAHESKGFRATV